MIFIVKNAVKKVFYLYILKTKQYLFLFIHAHTGKKRVRKMIVFLKGMQNLKT